MVTLSSAVPWFPPLGAAGHFSWVASVRTKPAEMPGFIKPQLATLKSKAPKGEQWLHEIKFDGLPRPGPRQPGQDELLHPQWARLDQTVLDHCWRIGHPRQSHHRWRGGGSP